MQIINILGRDIPLYLGVDAMEELKERLGEVDEAVEALESEADTFKKLDQGITIIEILAKGGAAAYNFANPDKQIVPPDEATLRKVISIAVLEQITPQINTAINEGMGRTVISMPDTDEKNSAGA